MKHNERYSPESLEKGDEIDPKGKLFFGRRDYNLYHIRNCGTSIDTIRQLYKGTVKTLWLPRLDKCLEDQSTLDMIGLPWHVGRGGKISGYQYKLQSNEEGLVILFKNFYAKEEAEGTHLKIECSPKWISERGAEEIQKNLNLIANMFLEVPKPKGCAIHLAIDIQGWEPEKDFADKFVTRARTIRSYEGISEATFEGLASVAAIFGKGESYLFGKADSLQVAIYDKSKEIQISDKQDYFFRRWEIYTLGAFDKDQDVWRIEMRFHHNVLRELGRSQNLTFESFADIYEHLKDLWLYALTNNWLKDGSIYLHPFWQLIKEDAEFDHPPNGFYFHREKKKTESGTTVRNYGQIIGNLITVSARQGFKTTQVMRILKGMEIYYDLLSAYRSVHKSESDIREMVEKGLALRRIIGKAA